MKQFSKSILAMFLAVAVFSGCKKNQLIETVSDGSAKGEARTSARNIYVSPSGSDLSLNPHSSATPYRTIAKAASITIPGDNVLIMEGTYTPPAGVADTSIIDITRSGSAAGGYITYKPAPGATPILKSTGRHWRAIRIDAGYIKIENLEVVGSNNNDPNTMKAAAETAEAEYRAGGRNFEKLSEYNTCGIGIGNKNALASHHVEVRACRVHDFPGGGIAVGGGDYLTIVDNTTYNNSWFSMYGTSGISIHIPTHIDQNSTAHKIKVVRNTSYNNYTQVPYYNSASGSLSDGNGIIIDANNGTQGGRTPYVGRTLVENNVCYLNGGGGIHVFQSDHVDVFNNTAYANEVNQFYGNIDGAASDDCRFRNNIAYARSNGTPFKLQWSTNSTADYNVYFGGAASIAGGANSITTDPLFVDAFGRNFRLKTSPLSPAINAGMSTSISGTTIDKVLNTRLQGGRIDAGAYEMR